MSLLKLNPKALQKPLLYRKKLPKALADSRREIGLVVGPVFGKVVLAAADGVDPAERVPGIGTKGAGLPTCSEVAVQPKTLPPETAETFSSKSSLR
jgi:hypothetical protein